MPRRKLHKHAPEFKFKLVVESLRGERTRTEIARDNDITKSLLYKWAVGEGPVRRILRQMKQTRSIGRVIITDSNHSHPRFPNVIQGVTAVSPDHIWVGDITYLRYGRQFLYLAVILDAYTRAVPGWHLEEMLTCEALTLPALHMALQKGSPTFFHSDQGRQYAATDHVELLRAGNTIISMSDAGCPTQNGLVERFIRTVKEEHIVILCPIK